MAGAGGGCFVSPELVKEFGNKAFEDIKKKHSCDYRKPEHKISEIVRLPLRMMISTLFIRLKIHCTPYLCRQAQFSRVCRDLTFTTSQEKGSAGTEEIAIALSNLFSPFTFFKVSRVKPSVIGKSIAAVFRSNGKLMAIHQGTKDSGNDQHFYVWDVQEKVMSASFKSPAFLTVECFCCLSSSTRELILCGEYEIEIWEYTKPSCRLLTRLGVERPYNSVTFSQCTISSDNQLLVCCIANTILVYSLHDPDVNSSKRVLRGHLGRIEFCRFLKVNRYLISYGVDGMVFLWDISESKAAGFATIAQGNESIVSMAVSPEEDKVVCFTSSGRVCTIKLCELGSALSFRPLASLAAPMKDKIETAETSLQSPEQIASTSQIQTSPVEHDTTESLSSSDFEEEKDWYCDIWTESD
ncbi:Cilia- and flagella-associated protein 57 [Desmophyllum pertusum]|uniref:Cilia- and flagella-associated protein 57 n=1 Tax=Desmophyllum pertusum TaxID=174260 RepID=A0A9W9Z8L8_9CNID|nr:Cilia- and flagella-associated protein 57 [Desmophyllum pertusum]